MNPIQIIPWDTDFLPALKNLIVEQGQPGDAVVIFPHSRPKRYVIDLFRNDQSIPKPLILPRFFTIHELISQCRAHWPGPAAHVRLESLDQVALLLEVVRGLSENQNENLDAQQEQDPLLEHLAPSPGAHWRMQEFFPWGLRLAALLEECFQQLVTPKNIAHASGEVAPFAAALLASLGSIHAQYQALLHSRQLCTPGLDAAVVAAYARSSEAELPPFLRQKNIFLAGFVSLTQAENALLHFLWQQGATLCWHTDPALAANTPPHWACADHARWLHQWQAPAVLACPPSGYSPTLHFFAGYDVHSQLDELQKRLNQDSHPHTATNPESSSEVSCAVVLPHAGLLMPTLHHVPQKDINISLGYPLDRALVARLVDMILQVQESSKSGRFHWRALLNLIRHPYVRLLQLDSPESTSSEKKQLLRPLLYRLERLLRNGARLVDIENLMERCLDAEPVPSEAEEDLLSQVIDLLVLQWQNVHSLGQVAEALRKLGDLLLHSGEHIWPHFPLDAECLFRLLHSLAPRLAQCALAAEALPQQALFHIVRQAMAEERVPFEADPLTGLQVLGMLETRLLRFDTVYLLDFTDDRLPGAPSHDPLLPDSLRELLELPDNRSREILAAHTFHRLRAGARHVHLFWQEGVDGSGLLDSKKVRSRFVEEELWLLEQAQGRLLKNGEPPLCKASCQVNTLPATEKQPIPRSPVIESALHSLLTLSPTQLDTYLHCPAQFYHQVLCKLHPLDEVNEGDDPRNVGTLLHEVLAAAFQPFVGQRMSADDLALLRNGRMAALFTEALAQSPLRETLPAESYLLLQALGPLRLNAFLAQQQPHTILGLEQELQATIAIAGRSFCLKGKLDRIDMRAPHNKACILDYKTGQSPLIPPAFWQDNTLWPRLRTWTAHQEAHNSTVLPNILPDALPDALPDPLPDLAAALPSIQLPAYLYLYQHAADTRAHTPHDALWVDLRESGAEKALLGPDLDDQSRDLILAEHIPTLLHFLLTHLTLSPAFTPNPGSACKYCNVKDLCH